MGNDTSSNRAASTDVDRWEDEANINPTSTATSPDLDATFEMSSSGTDETSSSDGYESDDSDDSEDYASDPFFVEYREYRASVLADCAALKAAARMHMHPEDPVTGNVSSRCYFDRPSGPHHPWLDEIKGVVDYDVDDLAEEADARAAVLADCAALKERARWHLHPEDPVVSTGVPGSRCYFDRGSAPEQESFEDAEARASVLADCAALKERARWHHHPEDPVASTGVPGCRNFFHRPSSKGPDVTSTQRTRGESRVDQFEMDGDFAGPEPSGFDRLRESLGGVAVATSSEAAPEAPKGGSLSRSPSSVMLFMESEA